MKINGLIIFLFFLSISTLSIRGNAANIDSLETLLKTTDDIEVKIETTIEVGQHYRMLAMDTAIVFFNDAINMASRIGNRELAAKAAMSLAGYYAYASEETDQAYAVACQARDLISYMGDTSKLYGNYCGRAELFGGMVETDHGNYTEAQEYFYNALSYFEKIDDRRTTLFAYNQLTVIYSMQNMLIEAREILDKTITLCEENDWHNEEIVFQSNKGHILFQQGQYLKSIETLKETEKLFFKYADTSNYYKLGYIYLEIGNNYFEIDNYDSSYFYHLKAFNCNKQLNIPSSIIHSCSSLARDCVKRGELELAESYCEKMQTEIDSVDSEILEVLGYQAWISFYKASGQYQLAIDKMDTLMVHKEAMVNEQNIQEQTAQKMTFEFEKDRLLSERELELKNEIIETEKVYNNKLKIGLWILGGLLLGLTLLFYSNFKQRKTISVNNEKLNESIIEKETLLKEIHHRVKNNLQLISSLLGLQSESINDAKILSIFEEGQNRVQAMALIHQKLYQNDGSSEIDFEDYLKGLAGHFGELNNSDKEVKIEIDCEDIILDIDTAIPLGLIINELFTNAYKHAFRNIELPILSISIKKMDKGEYLLKMTDNGQGLPVDLDWSKTKSLGLRLIRNLVKQLIGKIDYENHENLSVFSIQFKNQFGRNLLD